jgi:hypothetical protein
MSTSVGLLRKSRTFGTSLISKCKLLELSNGFVRSLGLPRKGAIADYRVFGDQQHRHEGCLDGTVNLWDDLAAFDFKHNERFERMDLDFYADLCFNRLNDQAKYY